MIIINIVITLLPIDKMAFELDYTFLEKVQDILKYPLENIGDKSPREIQLFWAMMRIEYELNNNGGGNDMSQCIEYIKDNINLFESEDMKNIAYDICDFVYLCYDMQDFMLSPRYTEEYDRIANDASMLLGYVMDRYFNTTDVIHSKIKGREFEMVFRTMARKTRHANPHHKYVFDECGNRITFKGDSQGANIHWFDGFHSVSF